jgi:hypothetical protein
MKLIFGSSGEFGPYNLPLRKAHIILFAKNLQGFSGFCMGKDQSSDFSSHSAPLFLVCFSMLYQTSEGLTPLQLRKMLVITRKLKVFLIIAG